MDSQGRGRLAARPADDQEHRLQSDPRPRGLDSDVGDIATLLDTCQELGIKVEFGGAMFYVSNEFVRNHPDSKMVMPDGERIPRDELDYRWPRACIHHSEFRRQRNEFFDECARRFRDYPAVIAWDVHNEPSFRDCRCDHTLAVYRRALRMEFGGAGQYNRRFGTSFASLNEVAPPKARAGNVEAYRHWRAFLTSELNRYLNELRDIVRKHVPSLPITYNPTNPFGINRSSQDWWNLRSYDLMSASHYAASGEDTQGKSVQLAMMKALGPGKDWWIAEFQGGPFIMGDRHTLYNGKQMVLELNAALAHNMGGVIFYRWDPLLNGPEPWINAVVGVDNYDTERRLTLKRGIAELEQYREVLERGSSIAPSVAIYLRRDHAVHSSEMGYDLQQAMHGNYSMLSALGHEAAVMLDEFDPARCAYDAMIFPYTSRTSTTNWHRLSGSTPGRANAPLSSCRSRTWMQPSRSAISSACRLSATRSRFTGSMAGTYGAPAKSPDLRKASSPDSAPTSGC